MPNPSATITNPDDSVRVVVIGVDDADAQRTVTGTVTTSDYTSAYVAKNAPGEFFVKPNPAAFPTTPGSSVTVNVTFACLDASGNALPNLVVDVILQGPVLPSLATHLKVAEGPTTGRFPVLPDPGSAQITY